MSCLLPLLLSLTLPAWSADEEDDAPPPEVLDSFQVLPELSQQQHRWLRPDRGALSPTPRSQTDFTAYTLELGEVRVGVTRITAGLLPRVQVGTVPTLDLLGLYNGHGKVNLFTAGPVDLAAKGDLYALPMGDFLGTYSSVGGVASVVVCPWLSVHGGGSWSLLQFEGLPDPSQASPLIFQVTGADPADWALDTEGILGELHPEFAADAVWADVAMDVRINRRDSFVLQGKAMVWARVRADLGVDWDEVGLPPIAGLDEALSYEGSLPIADTYTASFSYQASWSNVDLRVGVGLSAVPYAWLLQSMELSWRFGGKTRRTERRMRQGWRQSREDVEESQDRLAAR